ncbi:RNA-binding transcriptional accessory protein [Butyricimonas sp. DFI.6.44]|nr:MULTISPECIES: Tex family protein [Butyricimonas]MCB6974692.1 RNA-binding transcriptional accessory protein [Butyricimonas synergistica]MCG4521454.1 RNA-binding transcriptional accessory protein [Butyricimonas sp. DFI.6.44]
MEYYMDPIAFVTRKSGFESRFVRNLLGLLDEGATIPFISRYRKEMTGSMDEVQVGQVREMYEQFKELEKRKKTVLESVEQQDKLTPELKGQIENCTELRVLEDIYLPYKPKKQTRASKAKAKGLEPLADILTRQEHGDVWTKVARFVKGDVASEEDALQGARDIIAERVSENERARNTIRRFFDRVAVVEAKVVKGKEEEGEKFADYFDYSEPLRRVPSHRMLAIRRGEAEGVLKVSIGIPEDEALESLERIFVKARNDSAEQVAMAVKDGYKRLLLSSIETEYLQSGKQKADEEAIKVFAENLRQLLLAPPLGNKRVLGIDPGFRTGCKVVCLDETGNLVHNETIFPHPPQNEVKQAANKISNLVNSYRIEAIAIGNGTAGRETERFIQNLRYDREIQVFVVSESGASIYSASKIARDEFPQYDVTVRGAVSIGRRLMDPLAELVKIDPKSIGVGQYQHDVDQTKLKGSLDRVVESCVNRVGVNVNTASKYLLTYVSGLGPTLAENVVAYIKENGAFKSRNELKKVKRMGEKAFEQCAGFLRIEGAVNPLDNSSVHPESYAVVERMAKDLGLPLTSLIGNEEACNKIDLSRYVDDRIGLPTLKDIIDELKKPGRDPRSVAKVFSFAENIHTIDDLELGMVVPGIVTNLTNFGAFVDIGVKQDGLVHISEIADKYISNPADVLSLNQHVTVKITQVDKARKRIGLSMKQCPRD